MLADIVPASVYGRTYGFERAMDNLGAIAGPMLALGLYVAYNLAATVGPGAHSCAISETGLRLRRRSPISSKRVRSLLSGSWGNAGEPSCPIM